MEMEMNRKSFVLAAALALVSSLAIAKEQGETANPSRPTVAVMDYQFGTLQKWWEGDWNVGKGVSDMLLDELLASGGLRLLERSQIDAVLKEQDLAKSDRAESSASPDAQTGKVIRARYFITGSVTKFGGEDKDLGIGGLIGAFTGKPYLAMADVATKKTTAHVELSTRVIDTTTGEIIIAVRSKGESKRRGMLLGGLGAGKGKVAGGSIEMGSSNFRDTILGEATAAAVKDAAAKLVAALSMANGESSSSTR